MAAWFVASSHYAYPSGGDLQTGEQGMYLVSTVQRSLGKPTSNGVSSMALHFALKAALAWVHHLPLEPDSLTHQVPRRTFSTLLTLK